MSNFQAFNAVRKQQNNFQSTRQSPQNFPALLEKSRDEIARALPRHLNVDRMMRIALTAFRLTPKLADCEPMSVLSAVVQASQLGLEIGLLGEAHLVPFKKQCQLIPGYMGLMKLARQSGTVADIYAHEVRENDHFHLKLGMARELMHEPLPGRGGFPAPISARGEIVGFYAVCVFKDGTNTFVTVTTEDVNAIRDSSGGYKMAKAYDRDSPWDTQYPEMGKKTAIRALSKYLPKSPELATALAMDAVAEAGISQNIDLKKAADGSYEPASPYGDNVNPETGEMGLPPANPAPGYASSPPKPVVERAPAPAVKRAPWSPVKPAQQPVATASAPESNQPVQAEAHMVEADKYLVDMRKSVSIDDLNDSYVRAEGALSGAALEAVNQEYINVKSRLDGNSQLFPR